MTLLQVCRKRTPPPAPVMALVGILLLAACAGQIATPPPAAATVSANAQENGQQVSLRPFSCSEFKVVAPHLGKITPAGEPNISKQDVLDRLQLPDWQTQERHLFGDTDETIKGTKENNAAWEALCSLPK